MRDTVTIRREVLDVEVLGTESDGAALQRRLPGVCADVLARALEAAFARVDPGAGVLVIERLAIDLPVIALARLDAELADAVHREVAEYFRRNPPLSTTADGTRDVGAVQRRTAAEIVDEALLEFLRTGRLPWSFRVPPGARLEQIVLETWGAVDAERAPPAATRAALLEVLALPHARARLVMQCSREFVTAVVRGLSPPLATTLEGVLHAPDEIPPALARAAFARRAVEVVLVAASARREPEAGEVARTAWRQLSAVERDDLALATCLARRWPRVTEPADAPPVADVVEAPPPVASSRRVEVGDEPDGILVDNAGLVLLHPFLPRFFEGLGVAASHELLDPGRAVGLLHHLATGELTAPEYELTVAKVLCDVSLDEPVEVDVGLIDAETEEAAALLDAAIRHWEALRGTSADALRAEFLMRAGTLAVDTDGDWLLRVEARTVDILLDQLPWGISLVKLPWMARLLRVEWR
jgi:hypothetical protein